jgi:homoaconitase/3-isopropylmalate dehydratase large subunit
MIRLLLEIETLKAILMESHMKMRNMSLETGGKMIFVRKWKRIG